MPNRLSLLHISTAMLSCQKHLFSLDPAIHYLNGAYMSPLLQSAEEAGIQGILKKRQPEKISAGDFFTDAQRLRALFARIVNAASADEVALIPSVSYGMAVVAKNLKAGRGQKIIVTEAQFPSNVYPWMALANERNLELQVVKMPSEPFGRGRLWNEHLLDAINDQTALVAIAHTHWANGTLFDLQKISAKTHRHGGLIVVDGTQSVGALPMDVRQFGLDALVCAGYKWLMGPYSTGYAWFGPHLLNGAPIEENWINRLNSEDFARLIDYQPEYQTGARRFDVGERSNFILVPMCIAALEQLLAWGAGDIQDYCRWLTSDAILLWQQHGYWVEEPDSRSAHLFGLQLPPHIETGVLQQKLKERGISVSVRGDFIRISPNVYNDAADIGALTEVLLAVQE